MDQNKIKVFKLSHACINDDNDVFIKTTLTEMEFVKLIKVLQGKAFNIEETFDLSPSEMISILLLYEGNRIYPNDEDLKILEDKGEDGFDYIEVDLYNVWEAANIEIREEDLNSKKYENESASQMIKNFIREQEN